MHQLEKNDRVLFYLYKKINPSLLKPVNFIKEKERFLNNPEFDPHFTYNRPRYNLDEIKNELQSLSFDNSLLGQLMQKRRDELLLQINILRNRGTPLVTEYASKLYGKPSQDTIQHAKKLLEAEEEQPTYATLKHNPASSVKKFLDAFMNNYPAWKVKLKELLVGANFSLADKTLYINKNRIFSEADIQRLIVHEIGTHIARAENASHQMLKMFSYGFPNYLITEEGLAVFNEERAGILSASIAKNYAARVIAVHLSMKHSFSTIYRILLEYFSKEDAFTLTVRAKRGLGDTSSPGSFTKDHIYLSGYFQVKNFARKHQLKDLYVGKIGTEHAQVASLLLNGKALK